MNLENLIAVAVAADAETEKESQTLKRLTASFDFAKMNMSAEEFATAKAKIEQQQVRVNAAMADRNSKRGAADVARDAEQKLLDRGCLERQAADLQRRVNELDATISGKKSTMQRLNSELPHDSAEFFNALRQLHETQQRLSAA